MRQEDIASFMAKYGAITSIEAPTIDSYVQQKLQEKGKKDDWTK
jgi:hypothetical protein